MNKLLLVLFSLVLGWGYLEPASNDKAEGAIDLVRSDTLEMLRPKQEHPAETKAIVDLLTRYHYKKKWLNDSISSEVFDNYLNALDPNKANFLQSDIEYLSRYRYQLDDELLDGKLDFAFQVFSIYRERSLERLDYLDVLLAKEFDWSANEELEIEREDWLQTREDLNELWRKIIKNQALSYKLTGQDWDHIVESLLKRYARVRKSVYQYNSEDVYQTYMNAFTSTYDPHTDYFSPIAKENFQIDMSASLEGIGARLTQQLDYTKVEDVIPGGPAFKSKKLQKDDRIIGVAQGDSGVFEDVIGWRIDDVVQKIRGPKGSVVRLKVLKHDKDINALPDTIRIVRDKIKLEESTAQSQMIPIIENGETFKLGVITIPQFYIDFEEMHQGKEDYTSTTRDVKRLIAELQEDGMDGLLIDLRFNGGGSLQEAVELTGLFIDEGPVVQVRDTYDSVDIYVDENAGYYYEGPLAVLTNRYSASASEIFSGAIQDYKRGIILGENTFGKGTVQNLIDLDLYLRNSGVELGQLKMTLAKFYRVTGSSTQHIGVAPDIAFPSPYDDEAFGESNMSNALPWDEIKTTNFKKENTISDDLMASLKKLYEKHLKTDDDLRTLAEDVDRIKEDKYIKSISLNYEERLKEQQAEKASNDLSTTIDINELGEEKMEVDSIAKKLSEDPYLKESLRLLATLTKSKIG
ncbi:MAG: carboxy terminal-processing peptidase [Cyclobacteriaceae bacterium]